MAARATEQWYQAELPVMLAFYDDADTGFYGQVRVGGRVGGWWDAARDICMVGNRACMVCDPVCVVCNMVQCH